jgi:hypothetical protein
MDVRSPSVPAPTGVNHNRAYAALLLSEFSGHKSVVVKFILSAASGGVPRLKGPGMKQSRCQHDKWPERSESQLPSLPPHPRLGF